MDTRVIDIVSLAPYDTPENAGRYAHLSSRVIETAWQVAHAAMAKGLQHNSTPTDMRAQKTDPFAMLGSGNVEDWVVGAGIRT